MNWSIGVGAKEGGEVIEAIVGDRAMISICDTNKHENKVSYSRRFRLVSALASTHLVTPRPRILFNFRQYLVQYLIPLLLLLPD